MELCAYQPGGYTIIDLVRNGLTVCFGKSLDTVREEYPRAEIMPLDKAIEMIDKAEAALYLVPAEEIKKGKFIEMLDVLPPMNWIMKPEGQCFALCEFQSGSYTSHYCETGGKYYHAIRKYGKNSTNSFLIECA